MAVLVILHISEDINMELEMVEGGICNHLHNLREGMRLLEVVAIACSLHDGRLCTSSQGGRGNNMHVSLQFERRNEVAGGCSYNIGSPHDRRLCSSTHGGKGRNMCPSLQFKRRNKVARGYGHSISCPHDGRLCYITKFDIGNNLCTSSQFQSKVPVVIMRILPCCSYYMVRVENQVRKRKKRIGNSNRIKVMKTTERGKGIETMYHDIFSNSTIVQVPTFMTAYTMLIQ